MPVMIYGIIVFGANGAGKTTFARELAHLLGCKHMDIEGYAFAPSNTPYTKPRPRDECRALMLADIEKHRRFVLSAVTGDFGDAIARHYKLAVHITSPKELRMQRLKQRGADKRFLAWAAARPLEHIDAWAKTLTCPVVHVDGTQDWRTTAANIAKQISPCEVHHRS